MGADDALERPLLAGRYRLVPIFYRGHIAPISEWDSTRTHPARQPPADASPVTKGKSVRPR